jgi:hypothetical protein
MQCKGVLDGSTCTRAPHITRLQLHLTKTKAKVKTTNRKEKRKSLYSSSSGKNTALAAGSIPKIYVDRRQEQHADQRFTTGDRWLARWTRRGRAARIERSSVSVHAVTATGARGPACIIPGKGKKTRVHACTDEQGHAFVQKLPFP